MKQIIDWERKGNAVRFYLGEKTEGWNWTNPDQQETKDLYGCDKRLFEESILDGAFHGHGWDKAPYELKAGPVHSRFVYGVKDVAFGLDDVVLEPSDGASTAGSGHSKDDFRDGGKPIIIAIAPEAIAPLGFESRAAAEGDYASALNKIEGYRASHGGALPEGVQTFHILDPMEEGDRVDSVVYRGETVPVFVDEPGQCHRFRYKGREYGCGAFNGDYRREIIAVVDDDLNGAFHVQNPRPHSPSAKVYQLFGVWYADYRDLEKAFLCYGDILRDPAARPTRGDVEREAISYMKAADLLEDSYAECLKEREKAKIAGIIKANKDRIAEDLEGFLATDLLADKEREQ